MDIVAERIFEEMSAAGTAHALPLNFRSVPEVRGRGQDGRKEVGDGHLTSIPDLCQA